MWRIIKIKPVPNLLHLFSHVNHTSFNPEIFTLDHTRILTCKLGWNCAGGLKNFKPENFRPDIFTPKTGLKFITPKQAWDISHLNRPENCHTWNRPEHFYTWKLDLFLTHVHVPSQTINTWRPSFSIPHIFHIGNESSSNQFIMYEFVLKYIIYYRLYLHLVHAYLYFRS